jgi:predicted ATPase
MPELPTGTVTFLFTDIEESTRLWQEHPDAMPEALSRHDEILRAAVERGGGHVVKSTGDGIYAVFERAQDAIGAAVAAQITLSGTGFEKIGPLRVRMALHTGEAHERDGDYFGSALNRVARLLAIGHGGQVLASAATIEVVGDALPADTSLIALGEHRLRDLTQPVRAFQLVHADLRGDFPPLRSLDAHRHNLPVQLTSFVGRDQELGEVRKLLAEARLVTLTGVGGTGKTRLALQAAAEELDSYRDGAWITELASIGDGTLVVDQVAASFGVGDMETDSGRRLADVLAAYLADKQLLLVLDNCEHVREGCAELGESLLSRCPELRILATSREVLGIAGEVSYQVPPLRLPSEDIALIEESEAVRLFSDRAAQVRPDFRIGDGNRGAVAEITVQLDGLPLAIELAAARVNILTPDQILERLGDRFRLLAAGRRTGTGRHETLRATMDWSYQLLDEAERALLRRLAVFSGGWTLEAAEAVSPSLDALEVLDLLAGLADKSLVDVAEENRASRYRLLETVRQYALEELVSEGEEAAARRRHAEYFLDLAQASESGLRGPDQNAWLRRLDVEHDNIRSALAWSIEAGENDLALRLVAAMGWFWWMRGHWKEALRWFYRTYERTEEADPVLRGRAVYKTAGIEIIRARPAEVAPLVAEAHQAFQAANDTEGLAWTTLLLGASTLDAAEGIKTARESAQLFSDIGDEWGRHWANFTLGGAIAMREKEAEPGIDLIRETASAFEALGDRWMAAWISFLLGSVLANQGKLEAARSAMERSLELARETEDRWIIPHARCRLGVVATMARDLEEAERMFEVALPVLRRIGDENCTALSLTYLGEVKVDRREWAAAHDHLTKALDGYRELRNPYGTGNGLRRLMWLAIAAEDYERAARLLGAAEALREQVEGFITSHDRARQEEAVEVLRAMLGEDRLGELQQSGAAMSLDEAVAYSLSE